MVARDLDRPARKRFGAGEDLWERVRERVVRPHAEERRGHLPAAPIPLDEERPLGVPPPPCLEERRAEHRLDEHLAGAVGMQVVEHVGELEAVLEPEREDDRLLVRRGLELEAESDAELLAEREAPSS